MPLPGKNALLGWVGVAGLLFAIPSFAESHARIVRLSDVQGGVQIDRNVGQGFEKALLNLPVTQGAKIETRSDGRAEVEFENGSILHLAPGTVASFPVLSLRDSGAKDSSVELMQGTAYLSFTGRNGDQFTLSFGPEHVAFTQAAHVRVQMNQNVATLAVLEGAAQVEGPSGPVEVAKKQSATFNFAGQGTYTLAKKVSEEPFDVWDKEQLQYHDRYLSKNNPTPYSYGVSDLNYYGSFTTVAGMGSCWQPYFAGAGWDPFMNGSWVWYPTGYTWVSAYPWGWMPYYYGSWNYLSSGGGWCWSPGSSWGAWNAVPVIVNAPGGFRPLRPPVNPVRTVVTVNRGPGLSNLGNRTVIARGSAGLGISRGSINNMSKLSQQAEVKGSATTTLRQTPMNSMANGPRSTSPRGNYPSGARSTGMSSHSNSAPRMQSAPSPGMGSSAPSMPRGAGASPGAGPRK